MTQNVVLDMSFICADHVALLRSLIQQRMVSGITPRGIRIHAASRRPAQPDWMSVDFHGKALAADWEDGSYVHVNGGDLVHISTRDYQLDLEQFVAALASVEFEAANVREIRWWDNPTDPACKAPDGTIGTTPLGFAVA